MNPVTIETPFGTLRFNNRSELVGFVQGIAQDYNVKIPESGKDTPKAG